MKKEKIELIKVIYYDLQVLKDNFILKNKKDFDYHYKLIKDNLHDLLTQETEPEPFCRWNFSGTVGEFNKYLEVMQEYN